MQIKLLVLSLIITSICYAQHNQEFYRLKVPQDSALIANNQGLYAQEITNANAKAYYNLAQANWRTKNNAVALTMFTVIEQSELPFFNTDYTVGSDIAGDRTTKVYGYGSATINYKNKASIYLAKLHIEAGRFTKALSYLELAKNTYTTSFSCGTGSSAYGKTMNQLYALCYEGLNQPEKVIELLLPNAIKSRDNNEILARVLKAKYTRQQLKEIKELGLASIEFTLNDYPSTGTTIYNYGTSNAYKVESQHTTGKGTIELFGETLELPIPYLKDGLTATREDFVTVFKDSNLYYLLFEYWEVVLDD